MAKKLFHMASGPSYEDFLDYEAFVQPQLDQTEDHHEGVAAFREKRKPNVSWGGDAENLSRAARERSRCVSTEGEGDRVGT